MCVLLEIFRVLADKAGLVNNPWANVSLRADDSMSRRELDIDEIERLYVSAAKLGPEWKKLLVTGIYTGLRLGDCCRLKWENVNLERKVIQVIPEKTKRHAHGRPVTIPVAIYNYGGGMRLAYSIRNGYRIPDYFRMDLALNIDPGHYLRKLTHMSFTLGVYNVTGRKNPYSVYYTTQGGVQVKGYMISVFAVPIPYLTLNLKFG